MPVRRASAARETVTINRAPVLALWAAVVAERLGFARDEALTLGKSVAGLNAYSKGVTLGLYEPSSKAVAKRKRREPEPGERSTVSLLHREVPVVRTEEGIRALAKDRPISPESADRYLESKFDDALPRVRSAMEALARSLPPDELAERAWTFYQEFRPTIPAGKKGWGAAGVLDLGAIRALAKAARAKG
jgi:hypothetical protein